jgi:tRNA(Ile)-lysidine synthase
MNEAAFLKQVRDTIRQYDMLRRGDRVLAAVSGGADSVCMMTALMKMKKELGVELLVGNMDHGLRGEESAADSRFVKDLAAGLGVEFLHKRTDARKGGKKGASLEERARDKRYAFLAGAASENGCGVIATGHTMDDQAETVLMKVVHGASMSGITGIPPVREEDGVKIIRPLIRTERADILAFLKRKGAAYVEDSSNSDLSFLRNRIRGELLPFLEGYNPRIKRALVNLADTLMEDLSFLEEARRKAVGKCAAVREEGISVEIRDMILQPRALRKEIFKELFRLAGGNVKKLSYRHWMEMDRLISAAEKGKSLDLPGDVRVTRERNRLAFRPRPAMTI